MKLGIFSKTFERPTLEENLDAVKGCGLDTIQFNLSCAGLSSLPDEVDMDMAKRIRQECAKRELHMAAVSGTFNMIHPDPKVLRHDIKRFRNLAAMCHTMGTSVITLCTGTRDSNHMWRWHPDNDTPAAWDDLIKTMRAILETAEEYDLELAVEPESANVINHAVKCRELLDTIESPRLKVVLDAANLYRPMDSVSMADIIEQALTLLGDRVIIAHAKDYTMSGGLQFQAAGTGQLDYDIYLELLRAYDFAGPLILHGLREREVARSIIFLQCKMRDRVGKINPYSL